MFISSERYENFNQTFRKDVNYNNLTSHKKQCFGLYLEDTFLRNRSGGKTGLPQPFRVNNATNI